MKKCITVLTIGLVGLLGCGSLLAGDAEDLYQQNLADYFGLAPEVVASIAKFDLPLDEYPVVLTVAKATELKPVRIAEIRAAGSSWFDIVKTRNVGCDLFYTLLVGDINSETYSPIYAHFDTIPQERWSTIPLSDDDFVNLANLRFIYKHHDYSVFTVMTLRDKGHDFVVINTHIRDLRQAQIKEEKAKARKEYREKQKEGK